MCVAYIEIYLSSVGHGVAHIIYLSHHATVKGSNKMVPVRDLAGNVKAVNSCVQYC